MAPDITNAAANATVEQPKVDGGKGRAFVTFLAGNGEYVKGVVGLAKGLRKVKSKYPLVVAILPDVPEEHRRILHSLGCIVEVIEPVFPPANQTQFAHAYYAINYSKLRIWKFDFEKMIYLDGGIQVFENIDHLFDLPDDYFYAVMDCFCEKCWSKTRQYQIGYCQQCPEKVRWPSNFGDKPPLYFNAGMFVFQPDEATYHDLLDRLQVTEPTSFAEQDFLNTYFTEKKKYKPIPNVYNLMLAMLWRHPENVELDKVKVVHYCAAGSKPWRFTGEEENMQREDIKMLVKKWWEIYEDETLAAEGVRFDDWRSESSFSIEQEDSVNNRYHKRNDKPSVSAVWKSNGRRLDGGSEKMKKWGRPSAVHPVSDGQTKKKASSKPKILDPQGSMLQKWNKIFVITCVMAVSVDSLFFYIPVIVDKDKCLHLDGALQITASVLRTFFDLFYILRIIFQFRTGFIGPSSRVFGRGELIEDPAAIMKRYLSSHFIVDILSIIPLPQVVVLAIIPHLKDSGPFVAMAVLKYIVLIQYVPRLLRIHPLFKEVTRTSGILTETAWAGVVYKFFLYMLASHVVGANWYLLSIESEMRCWRQVMKNASLFHESYLGCGSRNPAVFALLNSTTTCPLVDPNQIKDTNTFNYGIFFDALQSHVVDSTTDFPQKFFYCFWWGLRNLSSLGQNLKTSTYVAEIAFAFFIAIFGLVLFSLLTGNIQKYQQSTTVRVEEMRVKRRDVEYWMSHRMLPDNLKQRIRRYEQYKWQENRGVEEEALIHNLPKDIRSDIKRHLCLLLVKKVPMFENMNEQLLDAMCNRLKPALYIEKSCIVREEDPVDKMLFIMHGNVASMTTNGGRTGFFNSLFLKAGDFCGEELLTWALDPNSSNLPTSTRTVETISEVEAFALMADDLKFFASQFRLLINSKQLQHTFRLYSPQWKTWAACFIQAAWRRYWKKKIERTLREAEDKPQDALANEDGSTISLGETIYAWRFAANALRNLRENNKHNRNPQRLLPLLPPKPAEPDFTAQKH